MLEHLKLARDTEKAQLYLKSQKELQKLSHTQQYTTPEDTTKAAEKKSGRKFTTGEAEKYFSQAVKQ